MSLLDQPPAVPPYHYFSSLFAVCTSAILPCNLWTNLKMSSEPSRPPAQSETEGRRSPLAATSGEGHDSGQASAARQDPPAAPDPASLPSSPSVVTRDSSGEIQSVSRLAWGILPPLSAILLRKGESTDTSLVPRQSPPTTPPPDQEPNDMSESPPVGENVTVSPRKV